MARAVSGHGVAFVVIRHAPLVARDPRLRRILSQLFVIAALIAAGGACALLGVLTTITEASLPWRS